MSQERLREAVLFLAELSREDEPFGKTKLNKLLWFADVEAYKRLGHSITGEEYQKLAAGPAPRSMVPVLRDMERWGDVALRSEAVIKHRRERLIGKRQAQTALFSEQELRILRETVRRFWGKTAREISHLSHQLIAWKAASFGETIPLEATIWYAPEATDHHMQRAAALVNSEAYHAFHAG